MAFTVVFVSTGCEQLTHMPEKGKIYFAAVGENCELISPTFGRF